MNNTYVLNMLIKCMRQKINIDEVCKQFQHPVDLLLSMSDRPGRIEDITADSQLLDAILYLLERNNTIGRCEFEGDSLALYNRCKDSYSKIRKSWEDGLGINQDSVFEMLVDLCWLLASYQYSVQNHRNSVILLSNKEQICSYIRDYLNRKYYTASRNANEVVFIKEAIAAKRSAGYSDRFHFQHKESEKYYYSDYSIRELCELKEKQEHNCNRALTTYYALTVTSGLANAIMKGDL